MHVQSIQGSIGPAQAAAKLQMLQQQLDERLEAVTDTVTGLA
jgi:hypothetical protein